MVFCITLAENLNRDIMTTLEKKLQDLQKALKDKTISTNEYSSMYFATYQKIKRLKD